LNVLFDVYYLYFWPHFEPIWRALQSHDTAINGFATIATKDLPQAQELTREILSSAGLTVISGNTEEERLRSLGSMDFDVAFVGGIRSGYETIRKQSRYLCAMAHGLGTKQAYFTDSPEDADIRFTEGPQHHEAFKKRFPDLRTELVGMSKLDPLFQENGIQVDPLLQRYKLDPEKPTILWAPTFYPSSLEVLGKTVKKLSELTPYQWLIKPHHFTMFPRRWKYKRQHRFLHRIVKRSENIHLLPAEEYNILPWFRIADLLLSDTSSTLFEMVAEDKPVIQSTKYRRRWNHYLFPSRLFKDRLDTETTEDLKYAIRVEKAENLEDAIEEALADPEWLRLGRQETRDQLFYRLDGEASKRITEIVFDMLEINGG